MNDEEFFHAIGKKGAIHIIRSLLSKEEMTYSELEQLLKGSPKLTSGRLEELVKLEILNREVMSDKYRTVKYSLTSKGNAITQLIEQIIEFTQEG